MNGLGSGNEGQEVVCSRKEDGKGIQSNDFAKEEETSVDADELDAEEGGASWICGWGNEDHAAYRMGGFGSIWKEWIEWMELAWNSGIGSGLSVLGRKSSCSASSSDASSRYAVRSGMRRFGFGEMISSGDTTVAGGGDSGALQCFKGRGERDGVNVMRGPWVS